MHRRRPGTRLCLVVKVAGMEFVVVIRDPRTGRDLRVIRARGGEALGESAFVEPVALCWQRLGQIAADRHHALMRAVGLVGGEQIDIRPKRTDIRKPVRRVADPVDTSHGPGFVNQFDNGADIVDLADNVRAMRKADKADLAIEQVAKPRRVEVPRLAVKLPFPHLDAAVGKPPPGAGVGLVILIGDDDCIPGTKCLTEGLGKHIGVLGRRRAEVELVLPDPEHRRKPPARLVHLCAALP